MTWTAASDASTQRWESDDATTTPLYKVDATTSGTGFGFGYAKFSSTTTYDIGLSLKRGSSTTYSIFLLNLPTTGPGATTQIAARVAIDWSGSEISAYGQQNGGSRSCRWQVFTEPEGPDIYRLLVRSFITASATSATLALFPARGWTGLASGSIYAGPFAIPEADATSRLTPTSWVTSGGCLVDGTTYPSSVVSTIWNTTSKTTEMFWRQVSSKTDTDDGVDFVLRVQAEFPAFKIQTARPATITSTPSENP